MHSPTDAKVLACRRQCTSLQFSEYAPKDVNAFSSRRQCNIPYSSMIPPAEESARAWPRCHDMRSVIACIRQCTRLKTLMGSTADVNALGCRGKRYTPADELARAWQCCPHMSPPPPADVNVFTRGHQYTRLQTSIHSPQTQNSLCQRNGTRTS